MSITITLEVLCSSSVLAGKQSTKVNQSLACRFFLLYLARCMIIGPYADSSELSYTTTPSYISATILPNLPQGSLSFFDNMNESVRLVENANLFHIVTATKLLRIDPPWVRIKSAITMLAKSGKTVWMIIGAGGKCQGGKMSGGKFIFGKIYGWQKKFRCKK